MSQETPRHDITKKRVVYQAPGQAAVTTRRDVEYRKCQGSRGTDATVLTMDIYYPFDPKTDSTDGARMPAVVFVSGYSDLGVQARLGCKFKEMESYISWGQLVAASGLVAITYATSEEPSADVRALLQHVHQNAASLGIDRNRIGLWACSGHVPNALSVLMQGQDARGSLKCAVLCYGYMLDLDGADDVVEAAKMFGFVNPCAGKSVDDLPRDVPLFIARAGQDQMPRLNKALDRFLVHALACNLPMTCVNHPAAPHAFDLLDDSEASREIVKHMLAFMRFHLLA